MDLWLLTLDLIIVVGAATRLTRLVTVDTIGGPARAGLRWAGYALAGDRGFDWGDELGTCPHCMSVWLSAGVVASYALWAGPVWRGIAGAFAAAYAAGHLVAALDVTDD